MILKFRFRFYKIYNFIFFFGGANAFYSFITIIRAVYYRSYIGMVQQLTFYREKFLNAEK